MNQPSQICLSRIMAEPLAIDHCHAASWLMRTADGVPQSAKPGFNFFGDSIPTMTIVDGVAFVPVMGPLMRNPGFMLRGFGVMGYEDIVSNCETASTTPGVKAIVLHVDSPGGGCLGLPEAADRIASLGKNTPIVAFTDGMACSAAYWLACAARSIYATKSAIVANVGVIMQIKNLTKQLEMMGEQVSVFASGKYKASGHPAKPLTESDSAYFQGDVDAIGQSFRSFVTSRRPNVQSDSLEGQCFSGDDALNRGIVDSICGGLSDVKTALTGQRTSQDWKAAGFSNAATHAAYMRGIESGAIKADVPKPSAVASRADFSSDKNYAAYLQGVASGQIK
jgi:signal peptide peptidase SppA